MARKPDFFIVGAPKSGTTSLYSYLTQHPGVFMPVNKEPHFFYNRRSPGSPVLKEKDLGGYLSLFEGIPDDIRVGEASTSYLWSANAAREIKELQPRAKIAMVLRNPVDRAYSQYWNHVRDCREHLGFEEALEAEEKRIRQGKWHAFYYVECGRYTRQVLRYLYAFGRESVRVYLFEDIIRDTEGLCRDMFSFVGVDPTFPIKVEKVYNRGGPPKSRLVSRLLSSRIKKPIGRALPVCWKRGLGEWLRERNRKEVPPMDALTRAGLQRRLREDILSLEELIGRDLSHWREGHSHA